MQKGAQKDLGLANRPLAGEQSRGRRFPAGIRRTRSPAAREKRGRGTRKGRGTLGGVRVEPRRTGAGRPCSSAPGGGGAAPVTLGDGDLAVELQGEVGMPLPGLVGARGRRVGLRGELGR